MTEFGNKTKTAAYWTEYLQHFLNNILVCGELKWIENWLGKIQSCISFASPSEIRGGLTASWNLWIRFFKKSYPELFTFLKKRHFFIAGSEFIAAINRIKNPAVSKFYILSQKYNIANTVGILQTVIKATVILLLKDYNHFPWLNSKFHSNPTIRNFCSNLLHIIDPNSPIFRRNLASTE